MAGTTIILILANNTAFADFPRLGALLGADGFLPRQLTYRGSRLVFSRGTTTIEVGDEVLAIADSEGAEQLAELFTFQNS